jgi:hypothetical protein
LFEQSVDFHQVATIDGSGRLMETIDEQFRLRDAVLLDRQGPNALE